MGSESSIWQRYAAPRRPPCKPSRDLNSCNAQIEVGPDSRTPPRSSGKTRMTPTIFVGHVSASLRNQETNSSCWFVAVTFEIENGSKPLQLKLVLLWTEVVPARPKKCRERDHVAAAGNKQITSNHPNRTDQG